jgi:hypothetical protein
MRGRAHDLGLIRSLDLTLQEQQLLKLKKDVLIHITFE